MKLLYLRSGPLRVNTYFLINEETGKAVVIDGGENYNLLKKTENERGVKIEALLLTHAHFDHSGNAAKLQKDGAKVYIGVRDAHKLFDGGTLSEDFGRNFENLKADETVKDGDKLNVCGIEIEVIETPGHTDGSVTYKVGNMLFTGDTLFLESVGRTDFPTGSREQLITSVKKLFALSGDYDVFPGHEEFTTLSHERKYNDFNDYD